MHVSPLRSCCLSPLPLYLTVFKVSEAAAAALGCPGGQCKSQQPIRRPLRPSFFSPEGRREDEAYGPGFVCVLFYSIGTYLRIQTDREARHCRCRQVDPMPTKADCVNVYYTQCGWDTHAFHTVRVRMMMFRTLLQK